MEVTFLVLLEISVDALLLPHLLILCIASQWWTKVIMADGLITLGLDTSLSFPTIYKSDQSEVGILLSLVHYSTSSLCLLVMPRILVLPGITRLPLGLTSLMKVSSKICLRTDSVSILPMTLLILISLYSLTQFHFLMFLFHSFIF